jgi:hypothetical protein
VFVFYYELTLVARTEMQWWRILLAIVFQLSLWQQSNAFIKILGTQGATITFELGPLGASASPLDIKFIESLDIKVQAQINHLISTLIHFDAPYAEYTITTIADVATDVLQFVGRSYIFDDFNLTVAADNFNAVVGELQLISAGVPGSSPTAGQSDTSADSFFGGSRRLLSTTDDYGKDSAEEDNSVSSKIRLAKQRHADMRKKQMKMLQEPRKQQTRIQTVHHQPSTVVHTRQRRQSPVRPIHTSSRKSQVSPRQLSRVTGEIDACHTEAAKAIYFAETGSQPVCTSPPVSPPNSATSDPCVAAASNNEAMTFCLNHEATSQDYNAKSTSLTRLETQLLSIKNIATQQIRFQGLLTQRDQSFSSAFNALIQQNQLNQDTAVSLTNLLATVNKTTSSIATQVDSAGAVFQQLVANAQAAATLVNSQLLAASNFLLSPQGSEAFTINQQFLLNNSILALQEANAFAQVEVLFGLVQAHTNLATWQALSEVADKLLSRSSDLASLIQVTSFSMNDLLALNLVPFVSSRGSGVTKLSDVDRYLTVKRFIIVFSQNFIIHRINWVIRCDKTYFAMSPTNSADYTYVSTWMNTPNCAAPNNTNPPINVTCVCYSTLVEDISTSFGAAQALVNQRFNTSTFLALPALIGPVGNNLVASAPSGATASGYVTIRRQQLYTGAAFVSTYQNLCLAAIDNIADVSIQLLGAPVSLLSRSQGFIMRVIEIPVNAGLQPNTTLIFEQNSSTISRPYCVSSISDISTFVDLRNGLTLPFVILNGIVNAIQKLLPFFVNTAEQLQGALPNPVHIESRTESYTTGALIAGQPTPLNATRVNPMITQTTGPAIAQRSDAAFFIGTSPDTSPLHIADRLRIFNNVWTSTNLDPTEVFNSNLDLNSNITTVRLFNSPFNSLPATFKWSGYFQCLFTNCPVRVTRLNTTNGHIDRVENYGNRTSFRFILDVTSDSLVASPSLGQRRHLPTMVIRFLDTSTSTGSASNANNSAFTRGFNGYEFRPSVPTLQQLELQTGHPFDPYYATIGLSSYITEVVQNPLQPLDIQCVGRRVSFTALCAKFDQYLTSVDLVNGKVRFYPRITSTPWFYLVTANLLPPNSVPLQPSVPAGCPNSIQAFQRDADSAYVLITDTSGAFPLGSATGLSVIVRSTVCIPAANATVQSAASTVFLSSTVTQDTLVANLSSFQTRNVQIPSCRGMQLQVLTTSNPPNVCFSWSVSPTIEPVLVALIPPRLINETFTVRDALGDTIRGIGLSISNAINDAYTSLFQIITNLFNAVSASDFANAQAQLNAVNAKLHASIAAINAILVNSTIQFTSLANAEAQIQAAGAQLNAVDQAKINAFIAQLKIELAEAQAIINQESALLPEFNKLVNFESLITQSLLNANTLIQTAPRDFNWNDIGLYLTLINQPGLCPASWNDHGSPLFCSVGILPSTWLCPITHGQYIGALYLFYAVITAPFWILFFIMIAAIVAVSSTSSNAFADWYYYGIMGQTVVYV